jgi:hypothetical protein
MPSNWNLPGVKEDAYWSDVPILAEVNAELAAFGCDVQYEPAPGDVAYEGLEEAFVYVAREQARQLWNRVKASLPPDLCVFDDTYVG